MRFLLPITFLLAANTGFAADPMPAYPKATFYSSTQVPQSLSHQGSALAMDGDLVAVGSPLEDGRRWEDGAVKVCSAAARQVLRKFRNPGGAGARFGSEVAISGKWLVASATAGAAGAVYVFDLSSPNQYPAFSLGSPASGGTIGHAIAVSGNWLAATASGSVYLYDLTAEDPRDPVHSFQVPNAPASVGAGGALAMDGNRLVVSATLDSTAGAFAGAVHVYELQGAGPPQKIASFYNPAPTQYRPFGVALAISGNRVVVGAAGSDSISGNKGAAYVYDLSLAEPGSSPLVLENPAPSSYALFGNTVGISGNRVIVGNSREDTGASNAGSIYFYDLAGPAPGIPHTIRRNPAPAADDAFGNAVAISANLAVASAPGDDTQAYDGGSVYLYDAAASAPDGPLGSFDVRGPSTNDYFGQAVAIVGDHIASGSPNDGMNGSDEGRVYFHDLNAPAAAPQVLENPAPGLGSHFGYSMAAEGDLLVVGAPYSHRVNTFGGCVYVFDLAGTDPGTPVAVLANPVTNETGDLYFGAAVAISGRRVLVGASDNPGGGWRAGSAYVYDLDSATPTTPVASIDNPEPGTDDAFGASVAIDGTRFVVGCQNDDAGAENAGSAYLYELGSAAPVRTFPNPRPSQSDGFGTAVALRGSVLAIGSPYEGPAAHGDGMVFVYDLTTEEEARLELAHVYSSGGFGRAIAIHEGRMAVLAPGTYLGGCVIYDLESGQAAFMASYSEGPGTLAFTDGIVVVGCPGASDIAYAQGRTDVYSLYYHRDPHFNQWLQDSGLIGRDADQDAAPQGDRVANILKYAFNLDPNRFDRRTLAPGSGAAGLPLLQVTGEGSARVFRFEYIRRKNSNAVYLPKYSTEAEYWNYLPIPGEPRITPIPGEPEWERAVVEMPVDPTVTPRFFGTVEVQVPWNP
ncbi:hypothetical protein [Luteolibacter sp. Populi]|uniref:hypothetical protein n=1 Tax=Luteolibacter sp. Populi TaxID=3230487 RepID=UPI00346661B1